MTKKATDQVTWSLEKQWVISKLYALMTDQQSIEQYFSLHECSSKAIETSDG
jgi:hypothetical protein